MKIYSLLSKKYSIIRFFSLHPSPLEIIYLDFAFLMLGQNYCVIFTISNISPKAGGLLMSK